MKSIFTTILLLLLIVKSLLAQSGSVEVADLSVKVPSLGTQEFYYGFEEGDELNFSYKDLSKKGIKQIEIIEYPSNIKYSGYEVKDLSKKIKINKRAIYLFRFTNSALGQRVGAVTISRIPATEQYMNFNSNVTWKETTDTTYTAITKKEVVAYDTTYRIVTEKQLVNSETIAEEILNKSEQVAAQTTMNKPSESLVYVTLPQNYSSDLETREVISWAYWIGVGQEGHQAFEANRATYMKTLGSIATAATGNPLIGFALNQFAFLPSGNAGSNVNYYFLSDHTSATMFERNHDAGGWRYQDKGNGVSGYGKKEFPLQGTVFLGLHNDNFHNDINVNVKVVAVVLKKTYENKKYRQAVVTPRYETKIYKQPTVSIKKVPVHS